MDNAVEKLIDRIIWRIKNECGLKPSSISDEIRNYHWIIYGNGAGDFDALIGVNNVDVVGEVLNDGETKRVTRLSPFNDQATATARAAAFVKSYKDELR